MFIDSEELQRVDPDAIYYAITLARDEHGRTSWSTMTKWVGEGSRPRWELRIPDSVDPDRMRSAWELFGHTSVVVNSDLALAEFILIGGHALVEESIACSWLDDFMSPIEYVIGSVGRGLRRLASVPAPTLQYAPSKKLRMAVMRRDDFRCSLCGRRPADHVDIELHVHHIRPHGEGGMTEASNLITLCHTCHGGLDPHFEPRLLELVPAQAIEWRRLIDELSADILRYRGEAPEVRSS